MTYYDSTPPRDCNRVCKLITVKSKAKSGEWYTNPDQNTLTGTVHCETCGEDWDYVLGVSGPPKYTRIALGEASQEEVYAGQDPAVLVEAVHTWIQDGYQRWVYVNPKGKVLGTVTKLMGSGSTWSASVGQHHLGVYISEAWARSAVNEKVGR